MSLRSPSLLWLPAPSPGGEAAQQPRVPMWHGAEWEPIAGKTEGASGAPACGHACGQQSTYSQRDLWLASVQPMKGQSVGSSEVGQLHMLFIYSRITRKNEKQNAAALTNLWSYPCPRNLSAWGEGKLQQCSASCIKNVSEWAKSPIVWSISNGWHKFSRSLESNPTSRHDWVEKE